MMMQVGLFPFLFLSHFLIHAIDEQYSLSLSLPPRAHRETHIHRWLIDQNEENNAGVQDVNEEHMNEYPSNWYVVARRLAHDRISSNSLTMASSDVFQLIITS